MTRGVEFSKASFIAFISIGFIIILVVGLLSGFIARPNNCIEPSTTTSKPAVTTTSSPLASSATNSYATSGSTTASLVSTSTLTTSTTSSFSSSVTTTSVTTTTVTTTTLPTEIAYKLNLASFASIVSITRGIPNKNINVTLIENAAISYFISSFRASQVELQWTPFSPYFLSAKMSINSSSVYNLDYFINEFINNGYSQVFTSQNLPTDYTPVLSSFDAIKVQSNLDSSINTNVSTTAPTTSSTTRPPSENYRLPNSVIPIHYDLTFRTFFSPYVTTASTIAPTATTLTSSSTTTSQPIQSSAQSLVTSSQPIQSSAQSLVTSSQPIQSSAQSLVTSSQPIQSSAQPLVTSSQPIQSSAQSLETSSQPTSNILNKIDTREYFEGVARIKFSLLNSTDSIKLHVDPSLIINTSISLTDSSNNLIENVPALSSNYGENQFFQVKLAKTLNPGNYTLHLEFSGNFEFSSSLNGFYRTKYVEEGVTKTLLATQFQPLDARKAFPCFDEPALKATFSINIEHPAQTFALSNWPVKSKTQLSGLDNRIRTEFETTYKMSTYLAAWVVAPDDFSFINSTTKNGKQVRIFAKKLAIQKGLAQFALNTTVKVIDFFENDYFNISEALPPKIDMVGLSDRNGAMEHWGVVGFKESLLLFSESDNSVYSKQRVALIIAHELAHFWFGNYVTCPWWDDLWLNEAMASFLEHKAVDHVFPEMDIIDQYIVDKLVPVMYDDGYTNSQTVSAQALTSAEINSLFNSFTYDKGSSLLFMLEETVGKDNFRDGLRNYLRNNAFGSGNAKDFYNGLKMPAILQAANVSGEIFMDDFLNQINYPTVSVELDQLSLTNKTIVSFSQRRFLHSIVKVDFTNIDSKFNYTWKLYLQCKVGGIFNASNLDDNEHDASHLMGDTLEFDFYLGSETGSLTLNRSYSWIKCNKNFRGYYLTSYSDYNFEAVEYVLRNSNNTFSIGDRAHMLHSAFALSFSGLIFYKTPAYLSSYMEFHEEEYVPWKVYFWHLTKIATILEHRAAFKGFRDFAIQSARELSNEDNLQDLWDANGKHTNQLLKISAIEFLCRFQDEICLKNATSLFKSIPPSYFSNPSSQKNPVHPNYRAQVYKYHMQNSNNYNDWFLLDIYYYDTTDPQESYNSLSGLGFHRSAWILDGLLKELIAEETFIKPQDFFDTISFVGDNTAGRHQAWLFVRRYFDRIVKDFGNSRAFARTIKRICESFDNFFLLDELEVFLATTPNGSGYLIRNQVFEIVVNNIYWLSIKEFDIEETFFVPF